MSQDMSQYEEEMRRQMEEYEAARKAEAERQAREEAENAARQAEMDAQMKAESERQKAEEEARWDWTTITKRPDGSYVVNRDGLPCHLPPNDPRYAEPFKQAQEWEKTHTVEEKSAVLEPTEEMREQMRKAEEQAQRLPDLEDAVAELGEFVDEATTDNADAIVDLAEYADETMNTNSDAVVDLAAYVAELEERIAALEGAKE